MLCGVSHAYGLEVSSLSYLVIPWVFGCGTVCHVVIYGFKGFLIGLHSCNKRSRESYSPVCGRWCLDGDHHHVVGSLRLYFLVRLKGVWFVNRLKGVVFLVRFF